MTRQPSLRRSAAWRRARLICTGALVSALLGACATYVPHPPAGANDEAHLTPATAASRDLVRLPPPKGKIVVAVYGFRDETGQYKPSPASAFSTEVTQGAASMLIKALRDSGWFIPVEREDLQSLLTERRVIRAIDDSKPKGSRPAAKLPHLIPAAILLDGGIISYDSDVRTGGAGAAFLGIGLSTQYSVDQVGVNLRSVDVDTGEILQSVSTTKTIYSYEVQPSIYKFVNATDLLQVEGGYTSNEPAQLCVQEAIEAAVTHLIVSGIKSGQWQLRNPKDWTNPIIQRYVRSEDSYADVTLKGTAQTGAAARTPAAKPN